MKNAAGWVVMVELVDGTTRDVYSKKQDREQAHADVAEFCRNMLARVVTSTKA